MTADAPVPPAGPAGRWQRARVIWSPDAGSKGGIPLTRAGRDDLHEIMAAAGLGSELCETDSIESTQALAREAAADGYDLVVAAGGDGTIGAAATALLGSGTALGILPLGSIMNVPRSLGVARDLGSAGEALRTGEIRTIDVGEANGRPFFEAGSVGMNAALFREVEGFDRGDWLSILRTIWVAFRYRPARMTIQLDAGEIRTRALMISVANGPYTGIALTVAPHARLDDGLFDVVVFRRFSKLELLRHLASIAFGRRRYAPQIDVHRSSRVRVEARHPLPCRADAHDLGETPIEFRVRPQVLRVVVPRGAPDAAVTPSPPG